MPRFAKYLVIAVAALLSLLLIVTTIVALTFNPNDYKPLVIRLVQEKKQRNLQIPGDIKLTFFPKIGADLGQVSISERNNPAEFASIKSAKVSLELFPLLSQRRLVVDRIKIDGIHVNLKRFKDGTSNAGDLLGKQESSPGQPPEQPIKFNVDSVSITDAGIQFDDQQQGRLLELSDLKLETGKIASGTASDLDVSVVINSNKPRLSAKLSVKSGFMFTGDTGKQVYSLTKLSLALDAKHGPANTALKFKADGTGDLDLDKHTMTLVLKGSLDDSKFDARLGLTKFTPANYTVDVAIDRLDLDRYLTPSGAAPKPLPAAKSADKPIDLSALKDLDASGNVKIGSIKVARIKAANVRFALHAAHGKIDINPLAAELYGGSTSGAASLQADNPPHFLLRQNLAAINLGPLLIDAIGESRVEGRGSVLLDVSTQGAGVDQMKRNLNGSARLALRDGALRGINLAQTIRAAKAQLDAIKGDGRAQAGTGSSGEKTDFSEMTGSFRVTKGIAHNDDLSVKSPLLRLTGAGDINLVDSRLNYLVKATVVPSLQGQGGAELQALKGIAVPVKLSGPFSAIAWNIDVAGMAQGLARQKVDEKKEEAKLKAQQALDAQKNKLQDQLKDQLKGLFGK